MKTPTLCIYHGNCADGFGAAWAAHTLMGDSVAYHAAVHGREPPDVTGHHVLMVDFSYKRDVIERLASQAKSITILDHHKTARAELDPFTVKQQVCIDTIDEVVAATQPELGNVRAIFDMERSGAVMTWQYCWGFDDPVPPLLLHVQDRDLWRFDLAGTREIQAVVFSYPYSFEAWDALVDRADTDLGRKRLVDEGTGIERKHHKDISELLPQSARPMVIGGVKVMVANLPYTMSSDAAEALAKDAPFGACYFDRTDARIFSLRSRGEGAADVSEIAKLYGGGGHRNAAGFQMPLGWEGDAP